MKNGTKSPLRLTHVRLENWRNFLHLEVDLQNRIFVVGPNGSGKSNFLDAFRFLQDIAEVGGGFQNAVKKSARGQAGNLHCLAAKRHTDIAFHFCIGTDRSPKRWEYELRFAPDNSAPIIKRERVIKQGETLLDRPDAEDTKDKQRLRQSSLEQLSVNKPFRPLVDFFASIVFLQPVPQVLRRQIRQIHSFSLKDPYGGTLLSQLTQQEDQARKELLSLIEPVLKQVVPQLQHLEYFFDADERRPRLRAKFQHMPECWQFEDQLSDGTLRLIGLFFALLEGHGPLLLEEPDLSLHPEVVRKLPGLIARLQNRSGRQVLMTTHSPDLLRDEGIGLDEVLLLVPNKVATQAHLAKDMNQIPQLLDAGVGLADTVPPATSPGNISRLPRGGS